MPNIISTDFSIRGSRGAHTRIELQIEADVTDHDACEITLDCRVSAEDDQGLETCEFQIILDGINGRVITNPAITDLRQMWPRGRAILCATRCGLVVPIGDLLMCLWESGLDPGEIIACLGEKGWQISGKVALCYSACMYGARIGDRGGASIPA